jgi:hypothetical protein
LQATKPTKEQKKLPKVMRSIQKAHEDVEQCGKLVDAPTSVKQASNFLFMSHLNHKASQRFEEDFWHFQNNVETQPKAVPSTFKASSPMINAFFFLNPQSLLQTSSISIHLFSPNLSIIKTSHSISYLNLQSSITAACSSDLLQFKFQSSTFKHLIFLLLR